ncbi:MAG TPA: hypothetical protein VKF61_05160 [Candidatus Polarisedimenticolia bacterium]|nr:hypothetical protein [Candidatus Polarisedimenticolia bacterium]
MSAPRRWIRAAVPGAIRIVLCALLLLIPSKAPTSQGAAVPAARSEQADALRRLHAAIESAFTRCDHTLLKSAFSTRVKTFLSSKALAVRQGYYGADQAVLILGRGFEGRTTLRFILSALDESSPQSERTALRARWLYREEGASKSEARLTFTLVPEGGTWCIREIREMK